MATYRRVLERRAQENGVDFVNGVATAITPMAFYETVMVKGYGPTAPTSPTSWCRWIASSTRSIPLCPKSCGQRSCERLVDQSRLIHRRMSSKTVTKRTSMTPWHPRRQMKTAGLSVQGETERPSGRLALAPAQTRPVPQSAIGPMPGMSSSRVADDVIRSVFDQCVLDTPRASAMARCGR